jgi:calcineurin-like phosphoesterase family protein
MAQPQVWFTSDEHFGHRMVAGLRGFDDVDAYDEAVIRNWNSRVAPGDQVWLLGDVTLGKSEKAWRRVDRLNGTLHLILGNHDAPFGANRDASRHHAEWREHFASIAPYARRKLEGQDVLLSHFPYDGDHSETDRYTQFRLRDEGLPVIHGHVHSTGQVTRSKKGTLQIHVGLDAHGLAPVSLGWVQKTIREQT